MIYNIKPIIGNTQLSISYFALVAGSILIAIADTLQYLLIEKRANKYRYSFFKQDTTIQNSCS